MDPEQGDRRAGLPGPSVWPIGVAAGVACILVGLIVSWWVVAIGALITFAFGFLWFYELASRRPEEPEEEPVTEAAPTGPTQRKLEGPKQTRSGFLAAATLGLGAAIGALVAIPPTFLAIVPPFLKQGHPDVNLGPLSNFPQNAWVIASFLLDASQGEVSRRTAYIRNNGFLKGQPSFTIISNRCAHLGCPVQPNGLIQDEQKKLVRASKGVAVNIIPVLGVSGFSCPCHGGAYDKEGNRTAGPPVRALDRYEFSIKHNHLVLGTMYSVSNVVGTGAQAQIHAYELYGPGQHVDGVEQILYPWTPPS